MIDETCQLNCRFGRCRKHIYSILYYLIRDNVILGEIMETELKIIGVYEKDHVKGISMNEMARNLGLTYSYLYKNVQNMIRENILISKRIGRSTICSINIENRKARLLLSLASQKKTDSFLSKNKVLSKMLEEAVQRLGQKTKTLYSIILFGSYAKGREKKASDIDLLIIMSEKEDEAVHEELNTIETRYGKAINPVIVDQEIFKKMAGSKDQNVVKEAIIDKVVLYGFEHFWELLSEV